MELDLLMLKLERIRMSVGDNAEVRVVSIDDKTDCNVWNVCIETDVNGKRYVAVVFNS